MLCWVLALGANIGSAWAFLRFFRWVYALVPGPSRERFVGRFFAAGFLTVPALALATVLWLPRYLPSTGSVRLDDLFFHVYAVGLSEEAVKFAVFVFFSRRWNSLREERDGLIQAACVALAFAAAENFLYMLRRGPEVMAVRFFITMAGHLSFSALAGQAWARTLRLQGQVPAPRSGAFDSAERAALSAAAPYLLMGTLIHGFYNFCITLDAFEVSLLSVYLSFVLFLALLKRTEESSPFRAYTTADWRQAAARLLRHAAKDPLDWELRRRAALYLIYGGRLNAAEKVLSDALSRNPREPLLTATQAALRLLQGDEDSRFPLKLALFEMDERRRVRFVHSLRRALFRDRRRRRIFLREIGASVGPVPSALGYQYRT